jgi:hypothetical protein
MKNFFSGTDYVLGACNKILILVLLINFSVQWFVEFKPFFSRIVGDLTIKI